MKCNQIIIFLIIILQSIYSFAGQVPCNAPPTATTFFKPQTISSSLSLETALHDFKAGYRSEGAAGGGKGKKRPWLSLDTNAYYFQTFNAQGQTKQFLPNNQATIIVGQDNTSDVSSAWVGIVSPLNNPFKSQITFNPFRQAMGGTFKFLIDFGALFPDMEGAIQDVWTTYYIPITHLRHNLNLVETVISGKGITGGFANAIEALNNPAYAFGQMPPNVIKATAVDDMQWRIGWNFFKGKKVYLATYGVLFIPAGRKNTAKYLFEPTIGSGGHWSLGAGVSGSYTFWDNPKSRMLLISEFRWSYGFRGIDRRTFDLINGDWSRFLLVASAANLVYPIPGVNFFTRDALATPRNSVDFLAAFNYNRDQLTMEAGWDLWWKQQELLTLPVNSQPIAYAVKAFGAAGSSLNAVIYDITGCCPKTSLSNGVICVAVPQANGLPSDATPIAITTSDLNIASARKKSSLFMKVYFGLSWGFKKSPLIIGVASSSEIFALPMTSLKQWGVWAKAAYSF